MVGPATGLNTGRYFIICPTCWVPAWARPVRMNQSRDRRPLGIGFSGNHLRDMVRAQKPCCSIIFGMKAFLVTGGSMGGMQVLQWCSSYPEWVFAALPIAASTRHSAQNIAFHEVGRQAVMADPDWTADAISVGGHDPAAVSPWPAWRPYHLSFGAGAASQIRAEFSGPLLRHLWVRRRFPG